MTWGETTNVDGAATMRGESQCAQSTASTATESLDSGDKGPSTYSLAEPACRVAHVEDRFANTSGRSSSNDGLPNQAHPARLGEVPSAALAQTSGARHRRNELSDTARSRHLPWATGASTQAA